MESFFFVVETIRKSGYTQYAAALWAVAILIILVDYVSAKWRERILVGTNHVTTKRRGRFTNHCAHGHTSTWCSRVLLLVANLARSYLKELFNPRRRLGALVLGFLNFNLSPEVLSNVSRQMIMTLFQALLARR